MSEIQKYSFRSVKSSKLTPTQHSEISSVAYESLMADFPRRGPKELAYLIRDSAESRQNPNRAVGGPHLRANQTYAHSRNILAFNTGTSELVAQLPVANNASSEPSGLIGWAERQAKLHLPADRFLRSRWYWAGFCVLSREARAAIIDTPPDEASIIDVMITLGAQDRNPKQQASAYPYAGEELWKAGLQGMGYKEVEDSLEYKQAFGEFADPVGQRTFRIDSVAELVEHGFTKQGMGHALHQAQRS